MARVEAREPEQLKLSPIEAAFAAAGIAEMPEGVAALTRREMKFVLGVLEHGQMARAAIAAGYSETSAGAIASETLRKPKVFKFYRECVEKVASKGDELVRRVYERSVIFHAKAMEAAQQVQDANEWLLVKSKEETGKNAKDTREYELARDRAQRDERHYTKLATEQDTLLASLIGKLTLNVNGDMRHSVALTPEVREQLLTLASAGVPLAFTGGRS